MTKAQLEGYRMSGSPSIKNLIIHIDDLQERLDTAIDRYNDYRDEVVRLTMGLEKASEG